MDGNLLKVKFYYNILYIIYYSNNNILYNSFATAALELCRLVTAKTGEETGKRENGRLAGA